MRHGPGRVDGVAREPAADLVVDPAPRHRLERLERHLALPARQQQLDHRCLRELRPTRPTRPPPEAAVDPVVRPPQRHQRLTQGLRGDRVERRLDPRGRAERLDDLRALAVDLIAAARPRLGDPVEHHPPARQAVAGFGREVRTGVERDAVGRQERVQRPAAAAGDRLAGLHADRVDVGALLAVDLHAHEPLVHDLSDLLVLERLVRHHVAPVTGGIADRDEQRAVLGAGSGQRHLAPRLPVDGVVLVLAQVRRALAREAVRHVVRLPQRRRAQYATAHPATEEEHSCQHIASRSGRRALLRQ